MGTGDAGSVTRILRDNVLEVTLCRPERKNALNQEMYRNLTLAVQEAVENTAVRAVVLTGSNGCFTSGNDLQDFARAPEMLQGDNALVPFMVQLAECAKPVVVAVEGFAVGIGTTLLLHCDLIYAAPDAHFRLPFVNLGLCPEYASSFLLPRLTGHAKAAEWLLLGEAFGAEEALRTGLINAITDDPLALARQQAARLAQQPPEALCRTKLLMKRHTTDQLNNVMRREIEEFAVALQSEECRDALAVFFGKS